MNKQIQVYIITCNISQSILFDGEEEDLHKIFSYLGKGGYFKRNEKFNLCFANLINDIGTTSPQIYKLRRLIYDNVPDGYYFAVTGRKPTKEENDKLVESLLILNKVVSPEDLGVMNFLNTNYELYAVLGTMRDLIGDEKDKTKRTCRFCGKAYPDTTFEVEAHAISEALGNKTIINLDECDICNAEFGKGIESDIISYFDVDRVLAQIKNKDKNVPKIEFPEYKLAIVDNKITIKFKNQPDKDLTIDSINELKGKEYFINLQNIYRALCKYFISVANSDIIEHFSDTICWIKGRQLNKRLPKVAIATTENIYKQPTITYYIRKTEDSHLPFCVVEFRFTQLIISYIVPLNDMDSCSFVEDGDFNNYWEYMKHYRKLKWYFIDLSDDLKQKFTVKFEYSK